MSLKLSEVQSDIIRVMRFDAHRDLQSVAKQLKITEKTVRYNLESLKRNSILSISHFINPYPLGFRYVNLYFSVASSTKKDLQDLVKTLLASPKVSWLAELGGDFHYGVAFFLRAFEDLQHELQNLSEAFRPVLVQRAANIHLRLTMYPFKLLSGKPIKTGAFGYGHKPSAKNVDMDEIGWKLLNLLSLQPELSVRDLASKLERSPSAISARIAEFRRLQVLCGSWININTEALGYTTCKLLVYLKSPMPEVIKKIKSFCELHRNVNYLIECVGEWDMEVGLVVESAGQIMETVAALYDHLSTDIRIIKTIPLLRVLKAHQVPGC